MLAQFFLFFALPAVVIEKFCNKQRIRKLSTVKFVIFIIAFVFLIPIIAIGKPISLIEYKTFSTIAYSALFLVELFYLVSEKNHTFVEHYLPLFVSFAVLGGWIYYAFFL